MSVQACLAEIAKALPEDLDPKQRDQIIEELGEQIDRITRRVRNANPDDFEGAVMRAMDEFADDVRLAAIIERRNAALNYRARLQAIDYLRNTWGDDPSTGLTALLGGVQSARAGSRWSVGASQASLVNHYVTGMIARLEKEGLRKLFVSGKMDREIWRAMYELDAPEPNLSDLPAEAVGIARILRDYNELARQDANRAGAWIKKMPGYVVRQTHDMYRIRQAGFDEWRDFVMDRIDWERTLTDAEDKGEALRSLWQSFAAGVHVKFGEGGSTGFKGFANIGKKMSHDRQIHFKDADAAFEYHDRFGTGRLSEGMLYGLERMGQNTALMRHLGPNAEMNLDQVISQIQKDLKRQGADPRKLEKFTRTAERLKRTLWPNLTGESRVPGSAMGAKVSAGVRQVEQMSKLGGAMLSSIADIAFYGSEMRYQGGSMLAGIAEAMGAVAKGRTSSEKREVLGMLGVLHDGMRASAAARFDVSDNIPGHMAKTTQMFFKLSGLRWWTDRLRSNFALASSHRLAMNAGKAFGELGDDLRRVLGLFGIDEGKWDIIRAGRTTEADGRAYLTPEGVDDVPDEVVGAYLTARGQNPTPAKLKNLREEIKDQFRTYYNDRATTAVIEPDERTRAIMLRGTRPGTVEGEVLRHLMLFKSFTVTVIQKQLGREIYGRGANSLGEALRNGNGEMQGLAQLILWNTVFGYAAMTAKDLAKGKEPRDPNDHRTWTAAMVQGGGLGIYGDFLFGEMKNRYGQGPMDTLLGPTWGTASDIADLYGRVKAGDDVAASAFRTALNNTPFQNLFYTRAALDYLILYQISESLNPGYLRRMERRIRQENENEFFVPPSQVVPYGG